MKTKVTKAELLELIEELQREVAMLKARPRTPAPLPQTPWMDGFRPIPQPTVIYRTMTNTEAQRLRYSAMDD